MHGLDVGLRQDEDAAVLNVLRAGDLEPPDEGISCHGEALIGHGRDEAAPVEEALEIRRVVLGDVVAVADPGVIIGQEVRHGGRRSGQITGEAEVIRPEDVDRSGFFKNVVVALGADGGKAIADGHIKAEAVVGLGITSAALGHALQVR